MHPMINLIGNEIVYDMELQIAWEKEHKIPFPEEFSQVGFQRPQEVSYEKRKNFSMLQGMSGALCSYKVWKDIAPSLHCNDV